MTVIHDPGHVATVKENHTGQDLDQGVQDTEEGILDSKNLSCIFISDEEHNEINQLN